VNIYSSNNKCEYLFSLKKTALYQYLNEAKHRKELFNQSEKSQYLLSKVQYKLNQAE